MHNSELLTVKQAADHLNVKESTVRKWILLRRIAYAKPGGRVVRIRRADLDTLIEDSTVPAREVRK